MPPFKTVNVTYSKNAVCKTLSIPFVSEEIPFGTKMTAAVWKQAVCANDFEPYANTGKDLPSRFSAFRTASDLYVGFLFTESAETRIYQASAERDLWSGDCAELHFGAMDPEPWLLQLCIGIRGNRFDSSGCYDLWQVSLFETEEGWGAEVRISLSMLRLTEGGFRFNLCRQSTKRQCYSTWASLDKRFHEIENCGQFLFLSYAQALLLRTGESAPETLDRKGYELRESKHLIRAEKVTHGPYLSNPDAGSVCISWETAGRVQAYLRYRKSGSGEEYRNVPCSVNNATLEHDTTHFVQLTGLEGGAEYEYEVCAMTPVALTRQPSGIVRKFRVPKADADRFSFFCIADLHSDADFLRTASSMKEALKADFMVLLGDNLSHAAGREALYFGAIDPIVDVMKQSDTDRPIVFVRGNHDRLGVYAPEYFKLMRHPSGKTYYTFRYGKVFFVVLDCVVNTGEPLVQEDEFLADEVRFLEEVSGMESYRNADFRVLMIHNPTYGNDHDTGGLYDMVKTLCSAEVLPDVMLSGHTHHYSRAEANAETFAVSDHSHWAESVGKLKPLAWPVVVDSTNMCLDLQVAPDSMTIRALVPEKEGTRLVDQVVIPKKDFSRK